MWIVKDISIKIKNKVNHFHLILYKNNIRIGKEEPKLFLFMVCRLCLNSKKSTYKWYQGKRLLDTKSTYENQLNFYALLVLTRKCNSKKSQLICRVWQSQPKVYIETQRVSNRWDNNEDQDRGISKLADVKTYKITAIKTA